MARKKCPECKHCGQEKKECRYRVICDQCRCAVCGRLEMLCECREVADVLEGDDLLCALHEVCEQELPEAA